MVMDEKTKGIQDEIAWYILFADDIELVDETKGRANSKLKLWKQTLEARRFGLSKLKS